MSVTADQRREAEDIAEWLRSEALPGCDCVNCKTYNKAADLVAQSVSALDRQEWHKVADKQPRPHARYLVRRDGATHTATPCYGMHAPWWVPMGINGREYDPVDMRDTDEWQPVIADHREVKP